MKPAQIAQVAHEINRAYCASQGDTSQAAWPDAPDWQRQSALAGVAMHLANPDATPEQSHESWLAQKTAEGWAYGEVKDADKKLHPCFVPYAELPSSQKAKDYLFQLARRPAYQYGGKFYLFLNQVFGSFDWLRLLTKFAALLNASQLCFFPSCRVIKLLVQI